MKTPSAAKPLSALAASRTGQEPKQEKVVFTMLQWLTHGKDQ